MMKKTEYFELVENIDLTNQETYNSMIMYDPARRVFARQKACGCRTIFPSNTIFHPTDGNCVILKDDSAYGRAQEVLHLIKPELKSDFRRIKTVKALNEAINHYNEL